MTCHAHTCGGRFVHLPFIYAKKATLYMHGALSHAGCDVATAVDGGLLLPDYSVGISHHPSLAFGLVTFFNDDTLLSMADSFVCALLLPLRRHAIFCNAVCSQHIYRHYCCMPLALPVTVPACGGCALRALRRKRWRQRRLWVGGFRLVLGIWDILVGLDRLLALYVPATTAPAGARYAVVLDTIIAVGTGGSGVAAFIAILLKIGCIHMLYIGAWQFISS